MTSTSQAKMQSDFHQRAESRVEQRWTVSDTGLRAISPAILSSITAPETNGTSDCFGISHDCVIEETTVCRQSKVGLSVVRLSLV